MAASKVRLTGRETVRRSAGAPDASGSELFVANQESAYHAMTLRSFDLSSGALISRVVLGSQFQSAYRVIRFGTDGLAIATFSSVVLYEGPLVQ